MQVLNQINYINMETIIIEISESSTYFSYIDISNAAWDFGHFNALEISFQHHEDNSHDEILLKLY